MPATQQQLIGTGIAGLDEVLVGGLPPNYVYLVQGDPGAGKTTLALQFLLEGVRNGEKCVYLTLSESERELRAVAASHGWSLDGITIYEHLVSERILRGERDTTMFHPAEIELGKTIASLLDKVEELAPSRVIVDSLAEIRLLSENSLRYRKQILALKQFFLNREVTALLIDDRTAAEHDIQLHSVPHGVIVLEQNSPNYGSERRRLQVVKLRGLHYRGGYHDFAIKKGGLVVYPRLIAAQHRRAGEGQPVDEQESMSSGVPQIDQLLGGGLDRGTSSLIIGPAGVGKSSLATQYAVTAAKAGHRVAMFVFDETRKSLFVRSESLGMNLNELIGKQHMTVQQIDPAELPPGEFASIVRQCVERDHASMVVIDSLNGYLNAMPAESYLTLHLHELLTFLAEHNVTTIIVLAQHGLIGSGMTSAIDVSYLADCVVLLRYFEAQGEILKAISVLKKRSGLHERSIRQFELSSDGVRVGEPLRHFRGILSGIPTLNTNGKDAGESERS
jgi:circadian clock protein KaiC